MSNTPTFYTSVERRGSNILCRYIDSNTGEHKKAKIEFAPELFIYSNKEVVARSVEDFPLSRMEFSTMKEASDFIERYREVEGFKVYGQKDFAFQFIARAYRDMDYKPEFIRWAALDIEVFSGSFDEHDKPKEGPFPEPSLATYPINAITVYDSFDQKFYTFGLEVFDNRKIGTYVHNKDHEKVGGLQIEYKGFESETELMQAFLTFWESREYDLYTGWNSEKFDTLYLYNRLNRLFGESTAKRMSPWKMISNRTITDRYGELEIVELTGLPCIDFQDLMDKHGFIEPANWKLGTVAEMVIGDKKIDYKEARSLNTLYLIDYQKFIEYNIHDVNLVKKMNDKKKFMELTFTLAYMMRCNYKDTFATVRPWSASVYMRLSAKGLQPEIMGVKDGKEIIGGFVQEPVPGRYDWVITVDAASLYPHMMMQFNMGPETILPEDKANKIREELCTEISEMILSAEGAKKEWLRKVNNAVRTCGLMHEFYFDTDEFVEFQTLKKHNVCMAPNCALFRLDKSGLWAEICKEVYIGRKTVKDEMLAKQREVEALKTAGKGNTPECKALEQLISSLDSKQHAYKIAMNSLYGATTNKYFVGMFDTRVGEAITSAGQVGIQYVGKKINEYFNQAVGTKDFLYAFYNDTDSAMVTVAPLVEKLFKGTQKQRTEEVINFMDKLAETKLQPLMKKWCEDLAFSMNCPENQLKFKREKLVDGGVWVAKKRYAVSVWDNEGVRYSEPKIAITGLEAVRSTYPEQTRKWLKETYKTCIHGSEEDLQKKVKEIEKLYKAQSPEAFAKVIACNNMEKYKVGPNQYGKGATKQVKAGYHHNQLVDRLGLNIPKILSGDKIMMVDLVNQNPLGMAVVGFIDGLPAEFDVEKFIDKRKSFEGNYLEPITNFCAALKWSPVPIPKLTGLFF